MGEPLSFLHCKPVSRVLYFFAEASIIYLGRASPCGSSSLPTGKSRASSFPLSRNCRPIWPYNTQGLPGCGCHHPHRWALTPPFHPYHPRSGFGGLVSEALSISHCRMRSFPLGSALLCVARTFLFPLQESDRKVCNLKQHKGL